MSIEDLTAQAVRIEKKLLDEVRQQRKELAAVAERLTALEDQQAAMSTTVSKIFKRVVHLEPDVHAVLRALRLDAAALERYDL